MTEPTQPSVIVLAGPNGAGKTTVAPFLLRDALGIEHFVNADTIAQGLSAYNPAAAQFKAGRIMLQRMHELAEHRQSFAFETTLASRSLAPWLQSLREDGYAVELFYLWLPDVRMAVDRVAARVREGGHNIPETVIRRRFERSIRNFFGLYHDAVSTWSMYDASILPPQLVAWGNRDDEKVMNSSSWSMIVDKGQVDDP